MSARIDLVGKEFGSWRVISFAGMNRYAQAAWLCRCECGIEREVAGQALREGKTRSCGCQKPAVISQKRTKHGASLHGETPEYRAWKSMRARCSPHNAACFDDYAGRGITVCDRWSSFEVFLEDMGPIPAIGMSLDRVDNDKGYEPTNCRWADNQMQAQNRRARRFRKAPTRNPVLPRLYLSEDNPKAKLTRNAVACIKELDGKKSAVEVAAFFGVVAETILNIWQGRTWRKA